MTRDDWKEVEKLLATDENVKLAMKGRCEETSHDWENCASVMFQVYQRCKWCGERR